MHEQRILDKVIAMAKLNGATRAIRVEVGELCDISPAHLREHLSLQVPWRVETTYQAALVSCACGYEGKPRILERGHDFVLFDCPSCGKKPRVTQGGEIRIVGVE